MTRRIGTTLSAFATRTLLLASSLLLMTLNPVGQDAAERRDPWLLLPQLGARIAANGNAAFTERPGSVQQVLLRIPGGGSHVNYGSVHTKVNTESADVVTKSASVADGLELKVDLTAGSGFLFQPGRNSVELEYRDQFGRQKYFNFLLDFQRESRARGVIPEPMERPPEKRAGRLFAVVIGISHYQGEGQKIPDLKYADHDAMSFLEFLKSPAGGAVSDDSAKLLVNERATLQNVRSALYTFLTLAQPQDTVVIYIAGHGAPDPNDTRNPYLLTADSNFDDMGGTAFGMFDLLDVFERIIKAKRVITFADTCHSYGFTGARNGETPPVNNLINQYVQRYAAKGERAVITASDISESSFEDAQWGDGHGVFTYYLLKGLKGEADRNHDGVVTAGELFAYLKRVVPEATQGRQNPRAMEGLAGSLQLSVVHRSAIPAPGKATSYLSVQ